MDIVTNEGVTALAQSLGNKRGWKSQMPASPPGLPAGGTWTQQRVGDVVRLRYQSTKGDKAHFIGEWPADEAAPAAHVNGTGTGLRQAQPPKPERALEAIEEPEPMIMLTPAAGGAWRLNGYGLETAEVIRALRLSLLHLVARQSGALIIDEVVAAEMAVVATERARPGDRPERPTPAARSRTKGKLKKTVSYGGMHDDLDEIDADEDERW